MSLGFNFSTCCPLYVIEPLVTFPLSDANIVETDFKVVLLPAPLPPNKATILPFGTFKETSLIARITSS